MRDTRMPVDMEATTMASTSGSVRMPESTADTPWMAWNQMGRK